MILCAVMCRKKLTCQTFFCLFLYQKTFSLFKTGPGRHKLMWHVVRVGITDACMYAQSSDSGKQLNRPFSKTLKRLEWSGVVPDWVRTQFLAGV